MNENTPDVRAQLIATAEQAIRDWYGPNKVDAEWLADLSTHVVDALQATGWAPRPAEPAPAPQQIPASDGLLAVAYSLDTFALAVLAGQFKSHADRLRALDRIHD